ncbi:hypothetical protein ACQY0O_006153 [Thecaphora frezii]
MAAPTSPSAAAAGSAKAPVVPPETLTSHMDALQLIAAMWAGDDELFISPGDADAIRMVGDYLTLPLTSLGSPSSQTLKDSLPSSIRLTLRILPHSGDSVTSPTRSGGEVRKLELEVEFHLRRQRRNGGERSETLPKLSLRSPTWLRREQFDSLCEVLADLEAQGQVEGDAVGYVMDAIERVSEKVIEMPLSHAVGTSSSASAAAAGAETGSAATDSDTAQGQSSGRVLRTWSYLPSLSSKEKRTDLVHYAQHHTPPLTGFVLAGKPGLVVLEHPLPPSATVQDLAAASASLDAFWSKIKSQSWADIPSGHKKVSVRYEEQDERRFQGFEEMTERKEVRGKEVVPFGGKRNKSDLGGVQEWLDGLGLEGRMEKVLGAEWRS